MKFASFFGIAAATSQITEEYSRVLPDMKALISHQENKNTAETLAYAASRCLNTLESPTGEKKDMGIKFFNLITEKHIPGSFKEEDITPTLRDSLQFSRVIREFLVNKKIVLSTTNEVPVPTFATLLIQIARSLQAPKTGELETSIVSVIDLLSKIEEIAVDSEGNLKALTSEMDTVQIAPVFEAFSKSMSNSFDEVKAENKAMVLNALNLGEMIKVTGQLLEKAIALLKNPGKEELHSYIEEYSKMTYCLLYLSMSKEGFNTIFPETVKSGIPYFPKRWYYNSRFGGWKGERDTFRVVSTSAVVTKTDVVPVTKTDVKKIIANPVTLADVTPKQVTGTTPADLLKKTDVTPEQVTDDKKTDDTKPVNEEDKSFFSRYFKTIMIVIGVIILAVPATYFAFKYFVKQED